MSETFSPVAKVEGAASLFPLDSHHLTFFGSNIISTMKVVVFL